MSFQTKRSEYPHDQFHHQMQHHESSLSDNGSMSSQQNKYQVGFDFNDRPPIQVQPCAIRQILSINQNDVLCGRGGRINGHYGNIQFRRFCSEKRADYFRKGIRKMEKAHITASVVQHIRSLSPPGRFLKLDADGWYDIGCAKAMTKVGQAIREHTPKADETKPQTTTKPAVSSSEKDYAGDDQGISDLPFSGPLYPEYQPFEFQPEHPNELPGSRFTNQEERVTIAFPSPAFKAEKRLSALSCVSGISRISSIMRESVQSDLSDGISVVDLDSNTEDTYPRRPVRRQSIFSDISDGMSRMSLSVGCRRSMMSMHQMMLQDENEVTAPVTTYPFQEPNDPSDITPLDYTCKSRVVSGATNNVDIPQQHRRRQERRGSIWSISMASALSFRSVRSNTTLSMS